MVAAAECTAVIVKSAGRKAEARGVAQRYAAAVPRVTRRPSTRETPTRRRETVSSRRETPDNSVVMLPRQRSLYERHSAAGVPAAACCVIVAKHVSKPRTCLAPRRPLTVVLRPPNEPRFYRKRNIFVMSPRFIPTLRVISSSSSTLSHQRCLALAAAVWRQSQPRRSPPTNARPPLAAATIRRLPLICPPPPA